MINKGVTKKYHIDYTKYISKKSANDGIKSLAVVIPSPFFVDRGNYSKDIVTTVGSRIKVISNHHKKGDGVFSFAHNMIHRFHYRNTNRVAAKLLGYICETLGFNTNKIILNPNSESIKTITSDKKKFYEAINYLENYVYLNDRGECAYKGFICKTTKPHVYVVNHEIIFKGNYDEFVTTYVANYTELGIAIDDKGRVILDKNVKYE